jgi:hypothetical protein
MKGVREMNTQNDFTKTPQFQEDQQLIQEIVDGYIVGVEEKTGRVISTAQASRELLEARVIKRPLHDFTITSSITFLEGPQAGKTRQSSISTPDIMPFLPFKQGETRECLVTGYRYTKSVTGVSKNF